MWKSVIMFLTKKLVISKESSKIQIVLLATKSLTTTSAIVKVFWESWVELKKFWNGYLNFERVPNNLIDESKLLNIHWQLTSSSYPSFVRHTQPGNPNLTHQCVDAWLNISTGDENAAGWLSS